MGKTTPWHVRASFRVLMTVCFAVGPTMVWLATTYRRLVRSHGLRAAGAYLLAPFVLTAWSVVRLVFVGCYSASTALAAPR
jgi:hypothetical protein